MNHRNKKIFLLSAIFIVFGLFVFLLITPDKTKSKDAPKSVPTIFVHGFKGGPRSFQFMLERFQNQYHWGKKTMVFTVNKNGELHMYGSIPRNQKNPLIQIIFENNRASIQDTTNWLKKVMRVLSRQYHVEEVNAVGHSMGGLVLTNFIEQSNDGQYPRIEKFITIGSPFKGIQKEAYYQNIRNTGPAIFDLKTNSPFLTSLIKHRNEFSPSIKVLSIAGVAKNEEDGDGVVSLDSALGLKDIAPKQRFESKIIYDPHATHSGLHEHKMVDQYIGEFLWGY
ncbi:alpha/beta hydrolase [Bacillus sp. FJAT-49736]|uniref:alpha/beta hydrolase n=1 Tax=Bacillus sp. FJAT-49736 TaxID=2833582 RepID=UPI001BCA314A|nr:alpha/beta hydrolase [Bacillus sp. FJAT-49736]MBS4175345.1 alpha/beta hydrolase [Bacillus sp. FJAT-49736]